MSVLTIALFFYDLSIFLHTHIKPTRLGYSLRALKLFFAIMESCLFLIPRFFVPSDCIDTDRYRGIVFSRPNH